MLNDPKNGSEYFKKTTKGMVDFQTPEVECRASGRPVASIPIYLVQENKEPLSATISIDTSNGTTKWHSNDKELFNPHDEQMVKHVMGILQGRYATEMLAFAPADVIYSPSHTALIAQNLENKVEALSSQNKEEKFTLSGARIQLSLNDSGTVKVHMADAKGMFAQEFTLYGRQGDFKEIAEKVQALGRISLLQESKDFTRAEVELKNVQLQVNEMTMRYGDSRHGDGTGPRGGRPVDAMEVDIDDSNFDK
jgi:hypothetical protein